MDISDQGLAALELEEGVVLKAYPDVRGVMTIGMGLTAASGVIKPVRGMTITLEQSRVLTREALKSRYQPAVEIAMTTTEGAIQRPPQNALDAGVSFHWNLGIISKATWVKLWKAKAPRAAIRMSMLDWSKAGGRVLPSLTARRGREASMLLDGVYRTAPVALPPHPVFSRWGLTLSSDEIRAVFDGLRKLGYDPGPRGDLVLRAAAEAFQRDHDLTADGIIGRATLTTLQRALDARAKATAPVVAVLAAPAAASAGLADQLTAIPHTDAATMIGAGLWLASHAWAYRDILAAFIATTFPRAAALLRRT